MKNIILILSFISSLNCFANLTENISVSSDYVWRGVTQTNHTAAVSGGVDYNFDFGLGLGTWISNTDSNTKAEQDIYTNYTYVINDNISIGTGLMYYHYLQKGSLDTSEFSLKLSLFKNDLSVNYTDNYFGTKTSSIYYNVLRKIALCSKNNINALISLGYTTFDNQQKANIKDYLDYKIGLERVIESYNLGFYYSDTNRKDASSIELNDQAYFVSLSKTF